jgi:hypothetical protein
LPSVLGGNQKVKVLGGGAKVSNPAYNAYVKQRGEQLRLFAGAMPDVLRSFGELPAYFDRRAAFNRKQPWQPPPEELELPAGVGYYGAQAPLEQILKLHETQGERSVSQVFVADVFPIIPIVKTANGLLILNDKVKAGDYIRVGDVVGVVVSFADDVLLLAPVASIAATKGVRVLRAKGVLKAPQTASGRVGGAAVPSHNLEGDLAPKMNGSLELSGPGSLKINAAAARAEFTHWSQWNQPADNAWLDYMRDLMQAYRATGRSPIISRAAQQHGGQRIWGGFDPVTEQITFYKGFDDSTIFEGSDSRGSAVDP